MPHFRRTFQYFGTITFNLQVMQYFLPKEVNAKVIFAIKQVSISTKIFLTRCLLL